MDTQPVTIDVEKLEQLIRNNVRRIFKDSGLDPNTAAIKVSWTQTPYEVYNRIVADEKISGMYRWKNLQSGHQGIHTSKGRTEVTVFRA